ncbi:MHYT domain-containing protein [Nocardia asteroides]|uniref:MHYT domain-containing protein n=1 Tax=Nocardia asteroides TaxID=1824 RepID=UPI001E2FAAF0|nr:MHYT domain-containing protein [Nocardia asteroides]UGT64453.1 hypothetical protein LTT61_14710 [Nocardia asteroides]
MGEPQLLASGGTEVELFVLGPWIAGLSVAISVLGALVGFACIVHSVRSARFRLVWLTAAAVSIGGIGIWLATSVTLLGLDVSSTVLRYDLAYQIAALIVAFAAVLIGLLLLGRSFRLPLLLAGGLVMGLGTATTLYLSLGSISVQGKVDISPWPAALAAVVAVLVCGGALWSFQSLRGWPARAATTLLFGLGIAGVYYLGLSALEFEVDPTATAPDGMELFDFVFPMFVVGMLSLTIPISAVLIAPDRRALAATAPVPRPDLEPAR